MAALLPPPSLKRPAASEHQAEQLQKEVSFMLAFLLLSFNSGLAVYDLRDAVPLASIALSYVVLVALFAWRLEFCKPSSGRIRLLKAAVPCLLLGVCASFVAFCEWALIAPPSRSVLLGIAATFMLGFWVFWSFFIGRCNWSKQLRLEIKLPLVEEMPKQTDTPL